MFDRSKSIFFDEPTQEEPRQPDPYLVNTDYFSLEVSRQIMRSYGVSIKYYDSGQAQPDRRVDYEVQLTIEPHPQHSRLWQLTFRKDRLFINRHQPDLVSEELSAHLAEVLNPIRVTVDRCNQIQDGIENHAELLQNWKSVKARILDKFEGEVTDRLIYKVEEKLANRLMIDYSLEKDMFWKAFFAPIYGFYGTELQRQQGLVFPVRHGQACFFQGVQTVSERRTDYDTYKIVMNGSSTQHGELRMEYDIDKDNGLLRYMVADNFWQGQHLIRFSAYQTDGDRN